MSFRPERGGSPGTAPPRARIVIVGASLAGVRAAEALRREGFDGRITLVGSEHHFPPYDRPPLSKQILSGAWGADAGRLRLDGDLNLDLLLGQTAEGLDLRSQAVHVNGTALPFDGLVVATGATPRQLPTDREIPMRGVHTLRTLDDCLRLRSELRPGSRIAIIGAGFIGSEVAATCRGLGLDVALVDIFDEPMVRALGPQVGAVLGKLHHRHGVRLYLGRKVLGVAGEERAHGVLLDGDELIEADIVVIAIGVAPETSWLDGSGLALRDGVLCDQAGFAEGAETVVAAGDVARWQHPVLQTSIRVEHWSNAAGQGGAAARNLVARLGGGEAEPYGALPYFWSDQYDWKLQFVGVAEDTGNDVSIENGAIESEKFVAAYRSAGRLVGALCVNCPSQLSKYRRRVLEEAEPPS